MIRIELPNYGGIRDVGIRIELGYERTVEMTVEAEELSGENIDRSLEPSEARELAAMLLHYANEAERPR